VAISSPAAITRATTLEPSLLELLEDSPEPLCVSAEWGGFSVGALCTPSTAHVAGPTTPSTASPWRACSRLTAAAVAGPNVPSASRCRAAWSRATSLPPD